MSKEGGRNYGRERNLMMRVTPGGGCGGLVVVWATLDFIQVSVKEELDRESEPL